ncbi:MAG: hypothetical protein ACTSO3_01110 [Candidatus Heimdallarchaeaceae archaeon]
MSNGLKGLIEKYAENADNGSFESLMCQFALDMIDLKKEVKELKKAKTNFFIRMGVIKASAFLFGIFLFNSIIITGVCIGILKTFGKL